MNAYECIVTYAKPCRMGGIKSEEQSIQVYADNGEIAAEISKTKVKDPSLLYIIMIEALLLAGR